MSTSRAGVGVGAVVLSGLAVLGLQSPAQAAAPEAGPAPSQCPTAKHYAPKTGGCVFNGMSIAHRETRRGARNYVRVDGFQPGTPVRVTFDTPGNILTVLNVGPEGIARGYFTTPADAALGAHDINVYGTAENGDSTSLGLPVKVVAGEPLLVQPGAGGAAKAGSVSTPSAPTSINAAPVASRSAATSGSGLIALAGAGALFLGAGPTAVYLGRRRRSAT